MDVRALIGRNFLRARRAAGLTQEGVQARGGFSQQYVSNLENGACNPEAETLFLLAEAVGVEAADLVVLDEIAIHERGVK